jgi:hypothetical protein
MKRMLHTFLSSGAVMLGSFAALILVGGGWQAVAMAVAIFAGPVFLVSLITLLVASEQPRSARPAWARTPGRPRAAPAERLAPETERAPAPRRRPTRARLSSAHS